MIKKWKTMDNTKKERFKWGAVIAIVLTLWFTGWHRPVVAGIQRAIVSTGIIQPDLTVEKTQRTGDAPNMFLIDEEGKQISLAEFGGKTVFINVWATWCPPCKAEMPGIQNLYEDVKDDAIQFVMIATDRDFELAKQYKKKNNYSFPIYQMASNFPTELNGNSIPRTYVLDAEGAIRMQHAGMAQYDTKDFREFLAQLQKENMN